MMTEIDLWSTRLYEFYFSEDQIDASRLELDAYRNKNSKNKQSPALYYTTFNNPTILDAGDATSELLSLVEWQITKHTKQKWTINSSWVNYVPKNNVHSMHRHGDDNMMCGILYYDNIGGTDFYDPRVQIYNDVAQEIKSEKGKCILFPGWLMHEMYPHNEEVERVTLPFNMNRVEL